MFKEIRKDKIKMQFKTKSDSFELKDIFECGQCFRWNKQEDNSVIDKVTINPLTSNRIDPFSRWVMYPGCYSYNA